jgi:hypothetical protein
MRYLLFILLLPMLALAATRDFPVEWSQECATVDGDSLDLDGDGVCELLTGFRFYDAAGNYLDGIPETGARSHTLRYNAPWGQSCHYMTAVMDDPLNAGSVLESEPSNTAACLDVVPGNPKSPIVIN